MNESERKKEEIVKAPEQGSDGVQNQDSDKPVEEVIRDKKQEQSTEEIPNINQKLILEDKAEGKEDTNEELDIRKKQEEIINFVKRKKHHTPYAILAIILWVAYQIRTSNIPLLRDVTTNKLIPLALDPHIFLRYARYLVEHGTLKFWDTMRYVPYGFEPKRNLLGTSYVSAYLYKIIHFFNPGFTLEEAHVLYPPIAFIIGMIFFYLLVKKLFNFKVALLSTATLAFIPTFLYRTMAGFSDKEALGFLLYFMIFYFYIRAWQSKGIKESILFGLFAGICTGLMALSWGGVKFVYLTIGGFTLIEIFLNKFSSKDFYTYTAWFSMIVLIMPILNPLNMNFRIMVTSFTSSIMVVAFIAGLIYFILIEKDLLKLKNLIKKNVPPSVACFIIAIGIGIIFLSAIYGPSIIPQKANSIYTDLISPYGKDRWQLTVAENHQPYTSDWIGQLGWLFSSLFLIGSCFLFYEMITPLRKSLKKFNSLYLNQISLTIFYGLFVFFFTFSRYRRDAVFFNGVSPIAKFAYIGSFVIFLLAIFGGYIYSYYHNKKFYEAVKLINKKYLFLIVWFVIMLVAARSAVRLFMVLAPVTVIISAYFIFQLIDYSLKIKNQILKYAIIVIIALLVISPYTLSSTLGEGYLTRYYKQVSGSAPYTGPSYNMQWQIAGQWVRENTPKDAVFIHWWDYGYWVQTGFERASVTDGGNAHGYWNYQIGRHVLTAQNETEALEVMYAHKATHFLIISDEIGKYTAYSSIGSDANYDRYSWINNFQLDMEKTQQKQDETLLFYNGQYVLDDDFTYNDITFYRQGAGIGGIFLPFEEREIINENNETQKIQKFKQPTAVLSHRGQRIDIPIECLYINDVKTVFDTPGLKGCFRIMPTISGSKMNPIGAGLYVSEEGVRALWTNLFLFNKASENFELIYDDSNQMPLSLYQGRQIGPLKIWKINYPEGFTVSEEKIKLYQGFDHENPEALII